MKNRLPSVWIGLLLSACSTSSSIPVEEDGKKIVEAYVAKTCLKLDSFKKVNITATNAAGATTYEMEYEANYSVAKELCHGEYDPQGRTFFEQPTTDQELIKKLNIPLLAKGQNFAVAKRKIVFVKKEKNWEGKLQGIGL